MTSLDENDEENITTIPPNTLWGDYPPSIEENEETEEENNLISVYYANSSFESRLFSNKINTSTEWLSIYKSKKLNLNEGIVCISDTLVALYEKLNLIILLQ